MVNKTQCRYLAGKEDGYQFNCYSDKIKCPKTLNPHYSNVSFFVNIDLCIKCANL